MPKRIFLIDDEKPMTQLIGSLLELNGFTFSSENDPEEGLARLLDEEWDAVIVDLMMPRMDGLALIGRLRESAVHDKTPIIVLSAKSLTDAERKSLLTYGVRFMSKPVTPSRLVSAVRESLGS